MGRERIGDSWWQLADAVFLNLQDRVEKTQHQRDLGKEPLPRLTRRFLAIGTDRARLILGPQDLGFFGKLAIAPLQSHRIGSLDHAHPQETAAIGPLASFGGLHQTTRFAGST